MKTNIIYSKIIRIARATLILFLSNPAAAQQAPTSAQMIEDALSSVENRNELAQIKEKINTLLNDQRLTDQPTRVMLTESKEVLTEMLDQKSGANTRKLVMLTKWMRDQGRDRAALQEIEGEMDEQQQFIFDNPLAGKEIYLTSVVEWVLSSYLEIDGENAGADNLDALLELYFNHYRHMEMVWNLVDNYLWKAPQWLHANYPRLTAEQKKQFLKDVNIAKNSRAMAPGADQEPEDPPTHEAQAIYDTIYQFIVNNTPPEDNPPEK